MDEPLSLEIKMIPPSYWEYGHRSFANIHIQDHFLHFLPEQRGDLEVFQYHFWVLLPVVGSDLSLFDGTPKRL
jgi:hypothetical protein